MRRCLLSMVIAGLCAIALGCGTSSSKLTGTWKMIYPETPDLESTEEIDEYIPVKMLNATHFAFGSMTPGGLVFGGGGRYSLDGERYTELVTYHSHNNLIGKRLEFTCRLDGDKWYHSGAFEVGGEYYNIQEIWLRVE